MRIVILGGGPTGLSAAWRLQEHGHQDWLLLESSDRAGGLSMSIRDDAGFTWDLGGHALSSHWSYFDHLLEQALGDQWVEHQRDAWVWTRAAWIPYPLQHNLWRLPEHDLVRCLGGLVDAHCTPARRPPSHFGEWLHQSFGEGLCETFMYPGNLKFWAYPPDQLGTGWMGEHVASVDLSRVLVNLVQRKDDAGWGPDATFRFPLRGGTGAIWTSIASQLPYERLSLCSRVCSVDTAARRVLCEDGTSIAYDRLISTIPLDQLLQSLTDCPDLAGFASQFVHSSSHIVGIGFAGKPPSDLATKCWICFPEPDTPFHRVTVFSNYSPFNVARPGQQWSLLAEVSESAFRPVNTATVVDDVIAGFRKVGLIDERTQVVSRFHRRLERGYPTPWLGRDEVLATVLPALAARGILSRGRFGAWRYEVSNQDHSSLQGVEAVDHLLLDTGEHAVSGVVGIEPPALPDARGPASTNGNGYRTSVPRTTWKGQVLTPARANELRAGN